MKVKSFCSVDIVTPDCTIAPDEIVEAIDIQSNEKGDFVSLLVGGEFGTLTKVSNTMFMGFFVECPEETKEEDESESKD